MNVSLCFFNDNGDKDSAGTTYGIELDALPRTGEYLLLDIDNDEFKKVAKTTTPTSTFKVMYVVHGIEDFDGSYTTSINLFIKPIYDLFG